MTAKDYLTQREAAQYWIGEDELLELTGYSSRGWLARWLSRHNIRYWPGKGGRLVVPRASFSQIEQAAQERVEFT